MMSTTAITPLASQSGSFWIGGDLPVSRLGFGAMRITGPGIWREPADPDGARALLRRVVELGIDFIDTADSYGPAVSEDLIREALYPYPERLVIATKGGLARTGPDQWVPIARPEYLRQCVEMSLRRLKLERIDLYQLHRIDAQVPVADQMGTLADLHKEGKILHVGLSEVSVDQIKEARRYVTVVSVQNLYNLANRQSEAVLDYCQAESLGFIPWFPVAAGDLAKPGGILDTAAQEHGATVAQIALAWLLKRSPVMLPIPGTSSITHLEENTAAAGVMIDDELFAKLSALRS